MSQPTGSSPESFLAALRPVAVLLMLLVPAARGASAQEPKPAPAPAPSAATGSGTAQTPTLPVTTVVVTASPIDTQEQMELVFDQFYKVGLDLEKPFAVHGLTLTRDSMELKLEDGMVYLTAPIAGRITGALFTGHGSMRMTIPNLYDRKLLAASYGKPVFEESIVAAVLRFDDDTDGEIRAGAKPGAKTGVDPNVLWGDRLKVDSNSFDLLSFHDLQMDYLETALNGTKATRFFMADVQTSDGANWFTFLHRGRERIEDGLYHERSLGAAGKRWFEILTRVHRPTDYDAKGNYDVMPATDSKDLFAQRDVTMTISIPNTKSVGLDAHITVEALRDGVRALRFELLNNIDAMSWAEKGRPISTTLVADEGGNAMPHLHRCHQLLVLLPRPLAKGAKTTIHVKADEDTIIELTPKSFWIYSIEPWFPQIGGAWARYTIDWTVKVSKALHIAGTGEMVKEWTEGDLACGEWKTDAPMNGPAFIFGSFKVSDGAYKREAPGSGAVPLKLFTILGGEENFKGKVDNVLFNIGQGIKTYETILGPIPCPQLDIAEMAHGMGFAQSPSGILLVSRFKDSKGRDWGLDQAGGGGMADRVIFHELAHQWWGHQVGPLTDEDAWISESWAEYSSALITEAIDKKRFHDQIDEWRRLAIEADPHGTIATAYRSDSLQYDTAYQHLVYDKGPYVVHMLRTWMGWDKFVKYVGGIQSKYKGTNINTDTLAREASAVMGYDMFPFFDQWVRDKGIPKVHWSWSASPDTDGKQILKIRVRQEDAENYKVLMVPITLEFGTGQPVVVLKPILKPETEILVKVPTVPKAVRMDDEATQLATFIAEGKGQ
jgi:Peptidase family M1 domain